MKKIFFLCGVLFFCWGSPRAETLKSGYPACVTEELYDQFMAAYMKNDKVAYEYLLKNGCFFLQEGLNVSVLEESVWTATAKVRVFAGDQAVVMWTHYKNINRAP